MVKKKLSYNIGDIVIRTGNYYNGDLAEIISTPTDYGEYKVRFLATGEVCSHRWCWKYFKLHSFQREPDWII